jgi:hypothetical protein
MKLALLASGHGFMVSAPVHSHRGPRLPLVAVATIWFKDPAHFHPLIVPAELACAWIPAFAGMTLWKTRGWALGRPRNAQCPLILVVLFPPVLFIPPALENRVQLNNKWGFRAGFLYHETSLFSFLCIFLSRN